MRSLKIKIYNKSNALRNLFIFLNGVGSFSYPLNTNISKLASKVNILGGPLKEFCFPYTLPSASPCEAHAIRLHCLHSSWLPPGTRPPAPCTETLELGGPVHSSSASLFSFCHHSHFST